MTTPKIVLYDQTGPAAGTRAARRSTITATTRKKVAPSFQTQPKFLTVFDPHFGHVTLAFMELLHVTMEQENLLDSVEVGLYVEFGRKSRQDSPISAP
jgi:hypothetical protein